MNVKTKFQPGDLLKLLSTRKFWVELVVMTVAMFVAAIGVHFFLKPSGLIVGSITGLSMVLSTFIPIISFGTIMFTINAILLVLSFLLIGNEFGAKTVYTALILGPFVDLLDYLDPAHAQLGASLMQDPWFDLLCFVVVLSASQAILFNINASTGGLDILGKIVNKYLHINLATSVMISGIIICSTAFLINPTNMVVMGLIGTWINGLVLDHFMTGMASKKKVCIISEDWEKLQHFIIHEIQRGVTLYDVTGGYSGKKKKELTVLLTRDEFASLMEFIRNEKIETFITASTISELYGLWFSKAQKKKLHV